MRSQLTQVKVLGKSHSASGKKSVSLHVEEKYKKANGEIISILWEITAVEDAIREAEEVSEGDFINVFRITTIKRDEKAYHKIDVAGSIEKIELSFNEGDVQGEKFI
jgi:hypothetical protein